MLSRPENRHLRLTSLERNTHSRRCNENIALFIIHQSLIFDGMQDPYNLIELGSNDGTFTILSHSTVCHPRRSYMIEVDHDRADVADFFVSVVNYVIRKSWRTLKKDEGSCVMPHQTDY